jgi:hypothetical protein
MFPVPIPGDPCGAAEFSWDGLMANSKRIPVANPAEKKPKRIMSCLLGLTGGHGCLFPLKGQPEFHWLSSDLTSLFFACICIDF